MKSFETSKHFISWTDPESGMTSYILNSRVAPLQQSFYFVNRSMTNDGRFLWFYCAFPPAADGIYGRTLAVVDFERDELYHYPETMFLDGSPLVDTVNGEMYWTDRYDIWKRGPRPEDELVHVAEFPKSLSGRGTIRRIATHLTFSADRKELCFDEEVGNRSYLGTVTLDTGEFNVWQDFDGCFNHAQFNPKDPDLILFAMDYWDRKDTGEEHNIERDEEGKLKRLWTIRRGQKAVPIKPLFEEASHEWWSADGRLIYYVDWVNGMISVDPATMEKKLVNPHCFWHGHSSMDDRYFVADYNFKKERPWFRGCESRVLFYDGLTDRKVNLVTMAPALYTREKPCRYHIDPHPQFVKNDEYIVYTSTVLGRVDVCAARTGELIESIAKTADNRTGGSIL